MRIINIAKAADSIFNLKWILGDTSDPTAVSMQTITDAIVNVITLALEIAGSIAIVLLLYASVLYALSFGDESKAETAKKTILWAIIGIAVIAMSFFIVSFVGKELMK